MPVVDVPTKEYHDQAAKVLDWERNEQRRRDRRRLRLKLLGGVVTLALAAGSALIARL